MISLAVKIELVNDPILSALATTQEDRNVRILYACESGSRAWGFASPDSDYDVRFFYIHPKDWYLSIDQKRDVIEAMLPGEIDLAGWDLRKTLNLLRKSNPALIEWLRSPIVYLQDDQFISELRILAAAYASPQRCFRHYLHMAEGNWSAYLQLKKVRHKKYFYVLRPVFAARWIERFGEMAPMEFCELLQVAPPETLTAIQDLLDLKAVSSEMDSGPPIPALNDFLRSEFLRLNELVWPSEEPQSIEPLNVFFRKWIG